MNLKKYILPAVVLVLFLSGCAALDTALKHRNLEIPPPRMSDTIFLEPTTPEKKSAWIDVRDTTAENINLSEIKNQVVAKGYKILPDPNASGIRYRLQVNVLYVGKASRDAIEESARYGFGGPLAGAITGGIIGGVASNSRLGPLAGAGVGGLAGGVIEMIAGRLVEANTYTIIADVQVSELSDTPVNQRQTANIKQGSSTQIYQDVQEKSQWKLYRTRVAVSATQVNLELDTAKPILIDKLARSISGIF